MIKSLPFVIITLMNGRTWIASQLKKAVRDSFSYRQSLSKLGLRGAGGNYSQLKKYIKEYDLDISHFKGRGWNRGMTGIGIPRIPLEKILVKDSTFQSFKLKRRLFKAGLKFEKCEECGWAERAEGGDYLPLEIDHINGDRHDNRLDNLRTLCPNCRSLKSTYRSRKRI